MMVITKQMLLGMGIHSVRADRYLRDLNTLLPRYNIDTPLRVAHFMAQVLHESGMMRHTKENMNYSASALRRVFRKYFSSDRAKRYARQPSKIGNRVYANRMGNGDEASGEGYRYRGRGLIQLTGKSNYQKFASWIGEDVVSFPETVADRHAVASAVFYWTTNNLNKYADRDNVKKVTKRINGGYNGLDDRRNLLRKAKQVFHVS